MREHQLHKDWAGGARAHQGHTQNAVWVQAWSTHPLSARGDALTENLFLILGPHPRWGSDCALQGLGEGLSRLLHAQLRPGWHCLPLCPGGQGALNFTKPLQLLAADAGAEMRLGLELWFGGGLSPLKFTLKFDSR